MVYQVLVVMSQQNPDWVIAEILELLLCLNCSCSDHQCDLLVLRISFVEEMNLYLISESWS
jgi:hypothetical protein